MSFNKLMRVISTSANLRMLLVAMAGVVLWAEPRPWHKPPETPEAFAIRLAEQHFQEFGFPAIVRGDAQLAGCASLNENSGGLEIASQEVVTEIVYGPRWVCVSIYTPSQSAEPGARIVRFTPDKSSHVFGHVTGSEFEERQRMGFRFPSNPAEALDTDGAAEFAARLPKILNIHRAGALVTVIGDFESGALRSRAAGIAPIRSSAKETPPPTDSTWPLKAALLLCFLTLAAVSAFLIRARLQLLRSAKVEVEAKPKPVLRVQQATKAAVARMQALSGSGVPARRALAFEVKNVQDERRVLEIDSLLSALPKHGVSAGELNEMITIARSVHAWAVKDNVACPLELVKLYLADRLEGIKKNARTV